LLWFMNQAVKNERLAVRQKLVDAYRGHLVLAQQRLETYWREMANDEDAESAPAALFARQVRAGLADALVCFDGTGKVVYPNLPPPPKPEPVEGKGADAERLESSDPASAVTAFAQVAEHATNTTVGARALQAQARCLIRAGKIEPALSVLLGPL